MGGDGCVDAQLYLIGVEVFFVAIVVDSMEEGDVAGDRVGRGPSGDCGECGAPLEVAEDACP